MSSIVIHQIDLGDFCWKVNLNPTTDEASVNGTGKHWPSSGLSTNLLGQDIQSMEKDQLAAALEG